MRDAIAIIMAILGTVLVLSGAAALWAGAVATARAPEADTDGDGGRITRSMDAMSRLPTPDRLIIWGVVLLALSAVAVGAITFGATATTGTSTAN
jgi:hypothetical protein